MTYELQSSDGTTIGELKELENNGVGNVSVPREIVEIIYSDSTFSPASDALVVAGDMTFLTQGQPITVSQSGYANDYLVNLPGGATGSKPAVLVNGNTHIPIGSLSFPSLEIVRATSGTPGTFTITDAPNGKDIFLPQTSFNVVNDSFAAANAVYQVASTETSTPMVVSSVTTGSKTVTLTGDVVRFFLVNSTFNLNGAGLASGTYTVVSATLNNSNTDVVVVESINTATVTSQSRVILTHQLTIISTTTAVPAGVVGDGTLSPASGTSAAIVAPTTIASTSTPTTFNVVYSVAGDLRPVLIAGAPFLVKNASVNGVVTPYVARVISTSFVAANGTYPSGLTQIATQYVNSTSTTPVIITDGTTRLVFPIPSLPYGYVTYQVTESLSPLSLLGRGASTFNDTVSWGQALQENMLHIVENFSSSVPPVAPMVGQLWYDSDNQVLRVKTENTFNVVGVSVGNNGTQSWSIDAPAGAFSVNDSLAVFNNSFNPRSVVYTATNVTVNTTPGTSTGFTSVVKVSEAIVAGSNAANDNATAPYGKAVNISKMHGVLGASLPATGDVSMSGYKLTNLANPVNPTDALNVQYADGRFVNVTGDTMTGGLNLSSANITMQGTGNIVFDSGGNGGIQMNNPSSSITIGGIGNQVYLLKNGLAAPTLTWVTASATTGSGNSVIDLGINKITNSSPPTASSDLVTKQYVDDRVNGIIWVTPVLDPSLFADNLSAPPAITAGDPLTTFHRTYIVNGTGTGAWTGFNGHLMYYDTDQTWKSVLGRAVQVGDRFGVFIDPDNEDNLSSLPSGGLATHAGQIATINSVAPYTYAFYTPTEPDAVTVKGTPTGLSPNVGHSYTFRGTWGSGSYGTNYSWIEFSGPQMLVDGAGLRYTGNILNVGVGTGIIANADSIQLDTTYADGRYVTKAATSLLSAGVNVTFSGGGEVLGLPTTPTTSGSAVSKTYADTKLSLSGGTMTGTLTLNANPTNALDAATKQYVDSFVSSGGGGGGGDPYYYNTSLSLHGEGANGSNTFTDSSIAPLTPTLTGTPTISTSQFKFGASSMHFNGTTDALVYANTPALNLASGDFTIECWVYVTSFANSLTICQKDQTFGSTFISYGIILGTTGFVTASVGTGSTNSYSQNVTTSTNPVAINTWTHIAFTRSGTTLRIFVNGVLSQTAVQTGTPTDGGKPLMIGRYPASGGTSDQWFPGYIDDFRITKGVARYTASFTAPTATYPDVQASNVTGPSSSIDSHIVVFNGTTGTLIKDSGISSAALKTSIPVACGDEVTSITTGTAKVTFRMPFAFTLTNVKASLSTAQATGSLLTIDVKKNGTTIFSTVPTFNNTSKTTVGATTPSVLSTTTAADDDEITIDVTQVGDGSAKGLKVYLIGYAS